MKNAQAVGEGIGVMRGCATHSDNFRDFGNCVTSHDYQSGILQNAQAATEFVTVTAACATHSDDFIVETAKNLLQFGLSREKIAQATGLTQAEVEALN